MREYWPASEDYRSHCILYCVLCSRVRAIFIVMLLEVQIIYYILLSAIFLRYLRRHRIKFNIAIGIAGATRDVVWKKEHSTTAIPLSSCLGSLWARGLLDLAPRSGSLAICAPRSGAASRRRVRRVVRVSVAGQRKAAVPHVVIRKRINHHECIIPVSLISAMPSVDFLGHARERGVRGNGRGIPELHHHHRRFH